MRSSADRMLLYSANESSSGPPSSPGDLLLLSWPRCPPPEEGVSTQITISSLLQCTLGKWYYRRCLKEYEAQGKLCMIKKTLEALTKIYIIIKIFASPTCAGRGQTGWGPPAWWRYPRRGWSQTWAYKDGNELSSISSRRMTKIVIFADLHSSHELRQLDDSLYDSCDSLPPLVAGAGRGGGAGLGHAPHLARAVPVGLYRPETWLSKDFEDILK